MAVLATNLAQMSDLFAEAVQNRFGDERGATAVEYGLMVALIAIVIIVGVRAVGVNLLAVFQNIALTTALN